MAILYERIEALCKKADINITTMCHEAGVNRSNISDLKTGRQNDLSQKNLDKIASYFNISVDSLLGRTSSAPISNDEIMFALLDGDVDEISDEIYNEVKAFAKFRAEQKKKEKI